MLPQSLEIAGYFEAITRQLATPTFQDLGPQSKYAVLKMLYLSNGAYEYLGETENDPVIRPMRNPAQRVVEFYADTLWPGSFRTTLKPVVENKRIIKPIADIWAWSNWDAQKQRFARWFSLLADGFIKVEQRPDGKPYMRMVDPEVVTDFTLDERGFVVFWRMDLPSVEVNRETGEAEKYTWVEIWEKRRMRVWKWKKEGTATPKEMGKPFMEKTFWPADQELPPEADPNMFLRFDFVPIVHAPFKIFEETYAHGALTAVLDKIHEGNRQATTLAERLYRYGRPDMALEGTGTDALGRPLPPPDVDAEGSIRTEEVRLDGEKLWKLPAGWKIGHLIANVNYSAALDILNAHMDELVEDLPELAYGRLFTLGSDSGRAIRYKLYPAISRVMEARANGESAVIRAIQMALTIGQTSNIWRNIGDFEAGDFEFSFPERDVIPMSAEEKADLFVTYATNGVPPRIALKWSNHTEEQITEFVDEATGAGATLNADLVEAMHLADQAKANANQQAAPNKQVQTPQEGGNKLILPDGRKA